MIGKRISHYEIQEKLGEGGMGVVYKAHDAKLNRTVALKFLPPDLTRDQEAIDRFINEAQAASSLDHANICTIYEIDETEDGQLYIAMACYAGETLEKKVSSEQLPVDSAIDIAMQAAQGLSRAHEAGIVHRDIKPSNLIITPRGEVKIIDFGLAKLTEPAQFTKTGRLSGTVAYMSPEQVQGQPIDNRADIWSLGVVLYQMLTGKPPFQGENEAEVIYSVVNEIPLSISEYRKDVSVGLSRIVNKALGKNRDARHHHVADLLDDLKLERKEQFETINLPAQKTNKSKNRKLSYLAAILIILISAAIGAYSMLSRFSKGPDQSSSSNHLVLAVLPFENLATTEDEYFVDGMTDEIASYLTAASDIVVISQTSASQYKDTKKSAKQIGEELNVDYILRGSFRWHELKEGQKKLRVAPQLIDVRNDTHLWARTYDFAIEEVFDVQANIAREVATALNTAFVEAEHRAAVSGFSLDIEAYDYYLRGNEYFERPGVKFQNMILACQMYEKSVHKDPAFATAFARLSLAYTALAAHYSDSLAYYSNRAKKTAFQALVLEPDLALARRALGMYYYQVEGNFVKALEELTIAQRLQPNESTVLAAIGFIFRRQGNYRDALGFLQQSLSLVLQR